MTSYDFLQFLNSTAILALPDLLLNSVELFRSVHFGMQTNCDVIHRIKINIVCMHLPFRLNYILHLRKWRRKKQPHAIIAHSLIGIFHINSSVFELQRFGAQRTQNRTKNDS